MSDSPNMTPPPAYTPAPPQAPMPAATGRPGPVNDTSKLLAALGYPIWIVALIAILIDPYKDEKFVKFHGIQALAMAVGWIVVGIVGTIVAFIVAFIPYVGWIVSLLLPLVYLAYFIYLVYLAVQAYNGRYVEVPLIYGIVKGMIGE